MEHCVERGSFPFYRSLAPAIWLAIVGASMLVMLVAVGYLSERDLPADIEKAAQSLAGVGDIAAQRAALAYSGVTAAITLALSMASVVWAIDAWQRASRPYGWRVIRWCAAMFASACVVLWYLDAEGYQPFASALGGELLHPRISQSRVQIIDCVPQLMFVLACVVPAVLATGASLLLQPLVQVTDVKGALRLLSGRLARLDQLLYVGALTLVFGTLQLSAAFSVPLSNMPKLADLKNQADLCKTLAPTPASSPFFASRGPAAKDLDKCRTLRMEFARVEMSDSLRQLTKGVTLSFGLAFSALLAAIYVPAVIGLRFLAEPLQKTLRASKPGSGAKKPELDEVDPIHRIATIAATLSPLLAGLFANALAPG